MEETEELEWIALMWEVEGSISDKASNLSIC